ncbi:DUF3037 domain-containing protein [Clostridium beijerinckii]|uniref:DUF3037 domain-containing protein n=1 Tax=Clostridium beijerinckii TaxID=1520 RepID=A0AAE5H4Q5_CLOBE|nr:DUF3037 domain-containing protein [Clostridium beijerinckii]AQS18306.1 DUF3037 domain-containing protein [Clostridium beijerinckii NRRL B-598]NSB14211.1 hypothetical protein [Clostridium beijerinckii]OOM24237.1 hypothetical protein CLOBE_39070 [Clostridium beijerinckii]
MFDIDYSILCHYPSLVSKDCITLAVLLFNRDTKETTLISTKNWNRVRSFNDDLDIDLIKLQLEGIKDEIVDIAKSPKFSLEKYTKFYVNDLKFTEIISTKADNFEEFVKECSRQYLISDFSKSERPSKDEQLFFIKKYLKNGNIECEPNIIKGYFNENICFDFVIEDYAFKLFRFEGRKETRLIRTVKDWAYDAIKLKNKYKIVFITDIDFEQKDNYKTLYNILNEEAFKILNFNEVISFVQSINSKQVVDI